MSGKKSMTVYEPGQKAQCGDVEVSVLAVAIRGESKHTEYHVSWWDEGNRNEQWVTKKEITSGQKMRVGF